MPPFNLTVAYPYKSHGSCNSHLALPDPTVFILWLCRMISINKTDSSRYVRTLSF